MRGITAKKPPQVRKVVACNAQSPRRRAAALSSAFDSLPPRRKITLPPQPYGDHAPHNRFAQGRALCEATGKRQRKSDANGLADRRTAEQPSPPTPLPMRGRGEHADSPPSPWSSGERGRGVRGR